MPIVVRLRPEMFNRSASAAQLATIDELVLVGAHRVVPADGLGRLRRLLAPRRIVVVLVDGGTPAWGQAIVAELLHDGVVPVVLTRRDSSWLSALRLTAPAAPAR